MMNEKLLRTFTVNVNMKALTKNINTRATFKKNDFKTGVLAFNLNMDGIPLDITDCEVKAFILNSDNEKECIEGIITSPKHGKVCIGLSKKALSCIGENRMELLVKYGEQKLYSPKMYYKVSETIFKD